ncbi:MAG: B12-binding domain-containing radical SAM protein [Anaerolineales bacterium]|nr:B12-binding domain-containing radical SAM protein [Anaerolineales bacterium]
MKITFIRPNLADMRSADAMEPLVFAILAGLTPPDVETALYDERLEAIPYDELTDLAALTVETYNARRAYQIATQFRRRGVPVVLGGYHPTFLPDEALQFADAVVIGDAEGLWPQVVEDARRKRLRRIYRQPDYPALGGKRPDRRIFRGKRYAPAALVQYGRGCRFACEFCSIHAFYGFNLRQRPVPEVVAEIEASQRRHIFLVDDNIFVDVPKAKALFRALIPLKIRWSCQVSIDVAQDEELLQLMEQSGCTTAVIGFESLDEHNLAQMKKRWNLKYGDYAASVQRFRDHGIMIYGSFVFGYDHDTVDSFKRSVEFAIRSNFYLANFNPLTPMPGAKLYERLHAEGRLIHDRWWLAPDYTYGQATFHPRGMTAEQLTEGCFRARQQFNEYKSIFKRALDFKTNCRDPYRLGLHLASNIVSRNEILRKQGMQLGQGIPLIQVSSV